MAGEKKGSTYEAIVKVCLDQLIADKVLAGGIFWNQTPPGMNIEPDLTVGPSPDKPKFIFLVTHCGSAKNSDMKSWRNLAELVEAKTLLSSAPFVYSIIFDSVIKEDLKKVQGAIFDGQLVFGDTHCGKQLQDWVDENYHLLPQELGDKAEAIKAIIADRSGGKQLRQVVIELSKQLSEPILGARPELESLWRPERKRKHPAAPVARQTFVRRGMSKLLIFEDFNLACRLYTGKTVKPDDVPQYAYDLGLASKSIGRAVGADPQIANVFQLLPSDLIRAVVSNAPTHGVTGWLHALRNLSHDIVKGEYVLAHFSELCRPEVLAAQLTRLHTDPLALIKASNLTGWPPHSVWLFEYIISLVRAGTATATGYGYAKLATEAARLPGMPNAANRVYTIVLSDWIHRRGHETLDSKILQGIATVLSRRLAELGQATVAKIVKTIPEQIAKHIIEQKLVCYRGFDPLRMLIQARVPEAKQFITKTAFAEAAGLGGQAGNMHVLRAKSTLINSQSATDAGKDHKRKELCARGVALRYSWDSTARVFRPRPGVNRLLLVLDGTWTQKDLEALARAGWDGIFYPDEIDKLAKAIV